jgi:hypothetical protein
VLLTLIAPLLAAAPRVESITPASRAIDVQPGVSEIVVRFSEPMAPDTWSVVGGGPHFPADAGPMRWEDERTFVWPVRLCVDWDYAVSFNHACCKGFTSRDGEEAAPFHLVFATSPPPGARPRTSANARAFDRLREVFGANDAHAGLVAVDWDVRFEGFRPRLLSAPSARSFARIAAELFAVQPDAHRWLSVGKWPYLTAPEMEPATLNADPDGPPALVEGLEEFAGGIVATGSLPDSVGYLRVTDWDERSSAAVSALRLLAPRALGGLVIDVRPNMGGDEALAQALAGCFVETPKIYALARVREDGAWAGPVERVLAPEPGCAFPAARTVVLQGAACASSNESFLLMMRAAGALLVGEATAGSSGRPVPHRLGNGVTAWLPSWVDLAPDGTAIEGRGPSPDLLVAYNQGVSGDSVVEAALRELRARSP